MASRPSDPVAVQVRGAASPADLAAVTALLAVLARRPPETAGYQRWRQRRRAALAAQSGRKPR